MLGERQAVSFEETCKNLEERFAKPSLICKCCDSEEPCCACFYAVGFHVCAATGLERYRKGSLYDRILDVQRVLFNLYRKGLPKETIDEKAQEYVDAGYITSQEAAKMMNIIEELDKDRKTLNEAEANTQLDTQEAIDNGSGGSGKKRLTREQLQVEIQVREKNMQKGTAGDDLVLNKETDQWRVYKQIITGLAKNTSLRMILRAPETKYAT